MRKSKLLFISAAFSIFLSLVFSTVSFASTSSQIRNSILRMHVIANSDSEEDQQLKLKVRDAVLQQGRELFNGEIDAQSAEEKLIPKKNELENAAKKVITENGFDYDVEILIGKAFFTTRTYDGRYTLPAGEYEAVNVIIGEGKGHNWWCVMFPPMCLPACEGDTQISDILPDSQLELVESNPKYEIRFKILELFESLKENLQ
ncbi:MAG: stage II sporulation protein R [Clostridia bacterium]|nr:stage II sporulation protein R [Clostridia bacterium]